MALLLANLVLGVCTCDTREAVEGMALLQSAQRKRSIQTLAENAPVRAEDDQVKLQYLSMIYNENVSDPELFDKLEMVYLYSDPSLPPSMLPGERRNKFADECKGGINVSSHKKAQQVAFIAPTVLPWRNTDHYKSRPTSALGGVPNFTWIEVTRTSNGWKEGNHGGCWFHVRRGSGVFVNTHRTLVITSDNKNVAKAAGLGGQSRWDWCSHALQQGYDSIQVLNMYLDGGSSEFIFCSGRCADTVVTTACVPGLELRTGQSADQACDCDPNIGVLSCGNRIAPKGRLTPCGLVKHAERATIPATIKPKSTDSLTAFDFHLSNIDGQVLAHMVDRITLPGIQLKWYPWKRILADQLEAALARQGLQMKDVDDEEAPIMSLIDSAGKYFEDTVVEMIEADDIRFPAKLRLTVLLKRKQQEAANHLAIVRASASEVFGCIALLLTILILCLLRELAYPRTLRSSVPLALIACSSFGVENFLIAYSIVYAQHPGAHMAMLFLMLGLVSLTTHLMSDGSSTYRSEWAATMATSWAIRWCIVMAGLFIAFAEIAGSISFKLDQESSGTNQTVVAANVIWVGLFFYFYSDEKLTRIQLMACALFILGSCLINGVLGASGTHILNKAFFWICVSAFCYSASIVTLRLSSDAEVPDRPKAILTLAIIGAVGFANSISDQLQGKFNEFYDTPILLMWPLLNAIASALGMWATICAYDVPKTNAAITTAIIDSNSLCMIMLNYALLGYIPAAEKLVGSTFILAGCTMLASVKT